MEGNPNVARIRAALESADVKKDFRMDDFMKKCSRCHCDFDRFVRLEHRGGAASPSRAHVFVVNMGRVDEALPLFREIFAEDENWAILTPRLPRSGLLPDDDALIERIVNERP